MGIRRQPVATDRRFRAQHNGADHGPSERWNHSGRLLELTEQAGLLAARATEEHALDVLAAKTWINATQKEAALRFKLDYHRAGMEARLIGSYSPTRSSFSPFSGWDERSDAEETAYRRWRAAMKTLGVFSDAVATVACHDLMPSWREVGALREGLDRLIKHYNLSSRDDVEEASARQRGAV